MMARGVTVMLLPIKTEWPELVGRTIKEATKKIKAERPDLNVVARGPYGRHSPPRLRTTRSASVSGLTPSPRFPGLAKAAEPKATGDGVLCDGTGEKN
ncbi:hypothetical protein GQ55_4G295100 [Panicum hallii var. hallii]|uniref:Uncharacterized protein n=1 Tax=Panicum hallii var. hallii TaxID=1504633 RepID=A0A2T7E1D4_9POAL|nr:hypothetical protein GQ55_4G295100 [Panicum hallii var. hallii]